MVKTYDSFNRLATETDARGNIKTRSYETARGLLTGITYSDDTISCTFSYNHFGQLTQLTDAAGTRSIGYNAYGEQETDSLTADSVTHLITESRDEFGRSSGFTYAKNGTVQHTVTTGYGTDGRIATAGFQHGGAEKQFGYAYLPGSNLLQTLTMPCNMTLTQTYETQRDLLTGMLYKRSTTGVVEREYTFDALGRPTARNTARNSTTVNDSFGYNTRSELTSATVSGNDYAYSYDNIGNRAAAVEDSSGVASRTEYTANNLNQYTAIGDFTPAYDADGNQTLVKTSTGIWSVEYNAENRPIRFTSSDGATIIECSYDYMGRRATKKVTEDGSITLHHRYLYRGYLQIACCDLTRSAHPCLWLLTWDPTQPVATRPLAIRKDGSWFAYGWDLTKNICEVFGPAGYIRTAYTYSPYGSVSADGDVTQPLQWSSEFFDTELALVYYNYRHYNPADGRWIGRDLIPETQSIESVYSYVQNEALFGFDVLGLNHDSWGDVMWDGLMWLFDNKRNKENLFKDGSRQSNSVKDSDIGVTLRKFFLDKNKHCKTCRCWTGVYNYGYKFPDIKDILVYLQTLVGNEEVSTSAAGKRSKLHRDRFWHALYNSPRASFVGSCSAYVFVDTVYEGNEAYIKASFKVVNTTSLESFSAGILPNTGEVGLMANWTQTYIWEEKIPCCEDRSRQSVEMKKEVEKNAENMLNSFPYSLYGVENISPPSNYFFSW